MKVFFRNLALAITVVLIAGKSYAQNGPAGIGALDNSNNSLPKLESWFRCDEYTSTNNVITSLASKATSPSSNLEPANSGDNFAFFKNSSNPVWHYEDGISAYSILRETNATSVGSNFEQYMVVFGGQDNNKIRIGHHASGLSSKQELTILTNATYTPGRIPKELNFAQYNTSGSKIHNTYFHYGDNSQRNMSLLPGFNIVKYKISSNPNTISVTIYNAEGIKTASFSDNNLSTINTSYFYIDFSDFGGRLVEAFRYSNLSGTPMPATADHTLASYLIAKYRTDIASFSADFFPYDDIHFYDREVFGFDGSYNAGSDVDNNFMAVGQSQLANGVNFFFGHDDIALNQTDVKPYWQQLKRTWRVKVNNVAVNTAGPAIELRVKKALFGSLPSASNYVKVAFINNTKDFKGDELRIITLKDIPGNADYYTLGDVVLSSNDYIRFGVLDISANCVVGGVADDNLLGLLYQTTPGLTTPANSANKNSYLIGEKLFEISKDWSAETNPDQYIVTSASPDFDLNVGTADADISNCNGLRYVNGSLCVTSSYSSPATFGLSLKVEASTDELIDLSNSLLIQIKNGSAVSYVRMFPDLSVAEKVYWKAENVTLHNGDQVRFVVDLWGYNVTGDLADNISAGVCSAEAELPTAEARNTMHAKRSWVASQTISNATITVHSEYFKKMPSVFEPDPAQYQKVVLIIWPNGLSTSPTRMYELEARAAGTQFRASNVTLNAGDKFTFGFLNDYRDYSEAYPSDIDVMGKFEPVINQVKLTSGELAVFNQNELVHNAYIIVGRTADVAGFNPTAVTNPNDGHAYYYSDAKWKVKNYAYTDLVNVSIDPRTYTFPSTANTYVLVVDKDDNINTFANQQLYGMVREGDRYYAYGVSLTEGDRIQILATKYEPIVTKNVIGKFYEAELTGHQTKNLAIANGAAFSFYSPCIAHPQDVSLKLDFSTGAVHTWAATTFSSAVNITVNMYKDVSVKTPATLLKTITTSLTITNNKPEQLYVSDLIALYPDLKAIDVKVTGFTASGIIEVDDKIELSASIVENNTYQIPQLIGNAVINDQAWVKNNDNTYTLSWTTDHCTASSYQLQLLRIYNNEIISSLTEDEISYGNLDWNSALTVEVFGNSLNLTLAEGTGFYAWRVRPVGNYYAGAIADSRNWGNWSTDNIEIPVSASLSSASLDNYQNTIFHYLQFDVTKNFIYNRVFTENNGIHEAMTYANGLQQVTQNQGKIASNSSGSKVLVSETLYDYAGRPAVETMAAPSIQTTETGDNPGFGFRQKVLTDNTNAEFGTANFDDDTKVTNPDETTGGDINTYYSNTNTDNTIPSAEGTPYTRIIYANDGSGMVKQQSGVGSHHKIGSGHTVTNSVATVTQDELLRIFGDESPNASTVQKSSTVDANGVTSITYTDFAGKVIATCLSHKDSDPNAPNSEPLYLLPSEENGPSGGFAVKHTYDTKVPYGDGGYIGVQEVEVSQPTEILLESSITPAKIQDQCGAGAYCAVCAYIYQIEIVSLDVNSKLTLKYDINGTFDVAGNCPVSKLKPLENASVTGGNDDFIEYDAAVSKLKATLKAPGKYRISRSVVPNPNGASVFINKITQDIDTKFQTIKSTIEGFTNNGDMYGLNKYLVREYQKGTWSTGAISAQLYGPPAAGATPDAPNVNPTPISVNQASANPAWLADGTNTRPIDIKTGSKMVFTSTCCTLEVPMFTVEWDPCTDNDITNPAINTANTPISTFVGEYMLTLLTNKKTEVIAASIDADSKNDPTPEALVYAGQSNNDLLDQGLDTDPVLHTPNGFSANFHTLIDRMFYDGAHPGTSPVFATYTCKLLLTSWKGALEVLFRTNTNAAADLAGKGEHKDWAGNTSGEISNTLAKRNLMNLYFDGTKKYYVGYHQPVASDNSEYFKNAYKLFVYDRATTDPVKIQTHIACENVYCDYVNRNLDVTGAGKTTGGLSTGTGIIDIDDPLFNIGDYCDKNASVTAACTYVVLNETSPTPSAYKGLQLTDLMNEVYHLTPNDYTVLSECINNDIDGSIDVDKDVYITDKAIRTEIENQRTKILADCNTACDNKLSDFVEQLKVLYDPNKTGTYTVSTSAVFSMAGDEIQLTTKKWYATPGGSILTTPDANKVVFTSTITQAVTESYLVTGHTYRVVFSVSTPDYDPFKISWGTANTEHHVYRNSNRYVFEFVAGSQAYLKFEGESPVVVSDFSIKEITHTPTTTPQGTASTISLDDIFCLAHTLVDECKSSCNLTPQYIKCPAQESKVNMTLFGSNKSGYSQTPAVVVPWIDILASPGTTAPVPNPNLTSAFTLAPALFDYKIIEPVSFYVKYVVTFSNGKTRNCKERFDIVDMKTSVNPDDVNTVNIGFNKQDRTFTLSDGAHTYNPSVKSCGANLYDIPMADPPTDNNQYCQGGGAASTPVTIAKEQFLVAFEANDGEFQFNEETKEPTSYTAIPNTGYSTTNFTQNYTFKPRKELFDNKMRLKVSLQYIRPDGITKGLKKNCLIDFDLDNQTLYPANSKAGTLNLQAKFTINLNTPVNSSTTLFEVAKTGTTTYVTIAPKNTTCTDEEIQAPLTVGRDILVSLGKSKELATIQAIMYGTYELAENTGPNSTCSADFDPVIPFGKSGLGTINFNRNSNWFVGDQARFTFQKNVAIPKVYDIYLPNTETLNPEKSAMLGEEGCASISDDDGKVLFYTNGVQVYDGSNNFIGSITPGNLSGLTPMELVSSTTVKIVPFLNDPTKFYILASYPSEYWQYTTMLFYSVVHKKTDGSVELISTGTNVSLNGMYAQDGTNLASRPISEGFEVIPNGNNYWVVSSLRGTRDLQKGYMISWKLDDSGFNANPVISVLQNSNLQHYFGVDPNDGVTILKKNRTGNKLALSIYGSVGNQNNIYQKLLLLDFNAATGGITENKVLLFTKPENAGIQSSGNLVVINCASNFFPYGVEFSPSGQYLYFSQYDDNRSGNPSPATLYQYNINTSTISAQLAVTSSGQLQLGPDGRIYFALRYARQMAVINSPDSPLSSLSYITAGKYWWDNGALNQSIFSGIPPLVSGGSGCLPLPENLCIHWISDPVKTTDPNIPVVYETSPVDTDPNVINSKAVSYAVTDGLGKCKNAQVDIIKTNYRAACYTGLEIEDFSIEYKYFYHHYTLYYYDRAGRLVKTVPPAGVVTIDDITKDVRDRKVATNHTMKTIYKYNSLGQLVYQKSPDGGASNFIYNQLGQLRFSQNAQQAEAHTYSYTRYDLLGRVFEVGETYVSAGTFAEMDSPQYLGDNGTQTASGVNSYPSYVTTNKTSTVYSDPAPDVTYNGKYQRYLNNRVSYTYVVPENASNPYSGNQSAQTVYSYDPHGNVEWIIQEVQGIGRNTIAYEYDLISNKVLKVIYNEARVDQFMHRYEYDADNRIVATYTSSDGQLWDKDANYNYYAHGPLKRTEIGRDKVQGLDYTYTIQGWLKAINSPVNMHNTDPGNDGTATTAAPDEFGMALQYYNGDFNRSASPFNAASDGMGAANATNSLYNGNIAAWTSRIQEEYVHAGSPVADNFSTTQTFRYDKLNRIRSSEMSRWNTSTAATTTGQEYATSYEYDGNGNILKLSRNADGGAAMDRLEYTYENDADGPINRLSRVSDDVDIPAITTDIKNQPPYATGNYNYDKIGNLVQDKFAQTTIAWNVYGKITSVLDNKQKKNIYFTYDATGNRLSKKVISLVNDGYGNFVETWAAAVVTFYTRDASGNVMAIYERKHELQPSGLYKVTFTLKEQPIYGSSRLGMSTRSQVVATYMVAAGEIDTYPYNTVIKPTEHISENTNMITALEENRLIGTNVIPAMSLQKIAYNGTEYAVTAAQNNVLGGASRNVAVAEDQTGKLLFYSTTPESYWGTVATALLYDANHRLIKGSDGIMSDPNARSVTFMNPLNTNQYVLVTRSATDKKLYMHTIDMSEIGYGTEAIHGGKVISKNVPLGTGTQTYGTGLAVIENYGSKFVRLFAGSVESVTNAEDYTYNTVALYSFKITDPSKTSGIKLQSEGNIGETGNGDAFELTVAPDGKHLAIANNGMMAGWFNLRATGGMSLALGTDYRIVTGGTIDYKKGYSFGITENNFGIQYGANLSTLAASRDGLTVFAVGLAHVDLSKNPGIYTIYGISGVSTTGTGNLFRGKNGLLYLVNNQGRSLLAMDNTTVSIAPKPSADIALSTNLNTFAGAYLPLQNLKVFNNPDVAPVFYTRELGNKEYELNDHLGNVTVTLNDKRGIYIGLGVTQPSANVLSYTNYYAFGMAMPGRKSTAGYRYGFNGKENDTETGTQDYGGRIYSSRLGKWLSIDPKATKYPSFSPYNFALNCPLVFNDPDGEDVIAKTKAAKDVVMIAVTKAFGQGVFEFQGDKLVHCGEADNYNFSAVQKKLFNYFVKSAANNPFVILNITIDDKMENASTGIPWNDYYIDMEKDIKEPYVIDIKLDRNIKNLTFSHSDTDPNISSKISCSEEERLNQPDMITSAVIWHEFGHYFHWYNGDNSGSPNNERRTVGFENLYRTIVGAPLRLGNSHGIEWQKWELKEKGDQSLIGEPKYPGVENEPESHEPNVGDGSSGNDSTIHPPGTE